MRHLDPKSPEFTDKTRALLEGKHTLVLTEWAAGNLTVGGETLFALYLDGTRADNTTQSALYTMRFQSAARMVEALATVLDGPEAIKALVREVLSPLRDSGCPCARCAEHRSGR